MKLTYALTSVLTGSILFACGTQAPQTTFGSPISSSTSRSGGGSTASGSGSSLTFTTGGPGFSLSMDGGASSSGSGDGGTSTLVCDDAGLNCHCSDGNTTTITGVVYDPAGKNPLYNVVVYVPDPASPLPNLDAATPPVCGCAPLYPKSVLAESAPTDASGHFSVPCAPSGNVSLVVQAGKWRMQYDNITVLAGQQNVVPNLRLPRNGTEGSLPNIAISTGGADSLECLPLRIGVDPAEYVAGSATGGHIHIYTGFNGASTAQGAVPSDQNLWDQQAHLDQHDVVLLSCEGQETTGGNPGTPMNATFQGYLQSYADRGGRVFASHFHYAWFNTGPYATAPNTLGTWITGGQQINDGLSFAGDIDTTLASGAPFPEGAALDAWLGNVGALTAGQLPIWFTRHNVQLLTQPPSTEWIHLDPASPMLPMADQSATQYFSVDTPIGATPEAVCGRLVYSDLHVSGGPGANQPGVPPDYANAGRRGGGGNVAPTGCAAHTLTPQEDALEFMLFDLSSCIVPAGFTTPGMPPPPVR
jgi:hypothetical protein